MQTDTLTLGVLTFTASISTGPIVNVRVRGSVGDVGALHLSLAEWSSLRALADVLAAADRRHAKDRAEIDVLKQEVRELEQQRDAARTDMEAAEQRMLGVLDGTFATGDGTAQREIERLRHQLDQLQPLVSVLGDWDWGAIAECGWHPEEDGPALTAACRALAHVAREKTKERSK